MLCRPCRVLSMSAVEYSQSDSTTPADRDQLEPNEIEEPTALEYAAQVYNRFLIFFVLYVLSIGPAFRLWMESMYLEGHPAIATFYYPLLLFCKLVPPFEDLVNWYIKLWWG
jgi:hypothetical protein